MPSSRIRSFSWKERIINLVTFQITKMGLRYKGYFCPNGSNLSRSLTKIINLISFSSFICEYQLQKETQTPWKNNSLRIPLFMAHSTTFYPRWLFQTFAKLSDSSKISPHKQLFCVQRYSDSCMQNIRSSPQLATILPHLLQ